MVEEPLLSVVVPTYNGEEFLEQCLDSVLAQTLEDFELICVDDGSTDGTPALLAAYARRDARVQVVRQENAGVSAARNNGMDRARGRYLLFLDDDDWFAPTMFERMTARLEADGADMCICGGTYYDMRTKETLPGGGFLAKKHLPAQCPFTLADAGSHALNISNAYVFNKMFRLDVLRAAGVRFEPVALAEDLRFVVKAQLAARLVTVVDEPLCVYRRNGADGAWARVSEDILAGYRSFLEIRRTMEERGLYEGELRQSFANRALASSFTYLDAAATLPAFRTWYETMTREGFAELGILGHDADYFHDAGTYTRLQQVLEADGWEDLLFTYYQRDSLARASANTRLRAEQAHVKQLKGQVKELKDVNAALKADLAHVRGSRSYRFARRVAALAKKLHLSS